MNLTGKCKEDFEKWYEKHNLKVSWVSLDLIFKHLPDSMQYGVYIDFFDSVGIIIEVTYDNLPMEFDCYVNNEKWTGFFTRQEARTKAIEKASEIYNESKV